MPILPISIFLTDLSVIRCGYPGHLADGHVIGRSYLFGDVVHYSCRQGYKLDGPKSRQCTKNGNWSGKRPVCQGKKMYYSNYLVDIYKVYSEKLV